MNTRLQLSRWLLYGVLLLAALFFLGPLYVMLATSFKDAEQIREGNLLSLPHGLNLESWTLAWSTACTGADCRGLQPYFWNSVLMTVPAVLVSTAWGAVNGYVLSLWKFRGSETLFGFMLFGVFMPNGVNHVEGVHQVGGLVEDPPGVGEGAAGPASRV